MERYSVSLRIQSQCGKMRTRVAQNTETFHPVTGQRYSLFWHDLRTKHYHLQLRMYVYIYIYIYIYSHTQIVSLRVLCNFCKLAKKVLKMLTIGFTVATRRNLFYGNWAVISAGNQMIKGNNRNTRKRHACRSMSLLLTLNIFHNLF